MGVILSAENLGFSYPGRAQPIFTGIDLDIAPREVVCILGPNGVGKSTLLRCLAGLAPPSSGSLLLDGKPLASLPRAEIARQLALVPQSYDTVFAFSVRTVVEMGRAPHLGWFDMPGNETSAMTLDALTTLGISHLIDAAYTEISGGERQLVQIARVLVQAPKLMIMDEPTAHLDFANQARFLGLVRELSNGGLAVIFTTHSPDHAFALAKRTLVLSPNNRAVIGTTGEILTEEVLSDTYGIPIRLVRSGERVLCVADV